MTHEYRFRIPVILLTLVFTALRIGGVIGWSWWWVVSPLWIPLALVIAIWTVVVLMAVVIGILGDAHAHR